MNKEPDKFERLFQPGLLRGAAGESAVPDQAVRWNLIGGLLFGLFWWIPVENPSAQIFSHDGPMSVLSRGVTLFLIVLMLGSVWFFLLDMFCGMSGGGKTSFRLAVGATAAMALAFCVRVALMALAWVPPAVSPPP